MLRIFHIALEQTGGVRNAHKAPKSGPLRPGVCPEFGDALAVCVSMDFKCHMMSIVVVSRADKVLWNHVENNESFSDIEETHCVEIDSKTRS